MKKKYELVFNYNNKKYRINGDSVYDQNDHRNIINTISNIEIKDGRVILKDKEGSKDLSLDMFIETFLVDLARTKASLFNNEVTKEFITFSNVLAKNYNTTPEGVELMSTVSKLLTFKKNNYNLIVQNQKKIDNIYARLNKSLKEKTSANKIEIQPLNFTFNNIEYAIDGNALYTGKSEEPYVRISTIDITDSNLTYENRDSNVQNELDKAISAEKALTFLGRIDSELYDEKTTKILVDYAKEIADKYNTDPSNLKGAEFMSSAEKIIKYKRDNYLLIDKNNTKIEEISTRLLNTLVSGAVQGANSLKQEKVKSKE